jgi:protein tweety
MEISAVILLTVLAISSLSGLLGEAQVDYSAGVVREAMTNTSDQFVLAQRLAHDTSNASSDISFLANGLVVSFNESDLPPPAFELSIRALQLTHVAKELSNATTSLLPHDYAALAHDWQFSYFMLKSTTNAAILAVALASFLSISSIGWSMVSPLRLSIFVILSVVPISHTLIGVYLSSTILTADFCAAPLNSTRTLLHTTPTVDYYLECPANVASPLMAYASSVGETTEFVASLQKELEDYALQHGETGLRMKREFLDPIGKQLAHVDSSLVGFAATQACDFVAGNVTRAMDAYCEFGMVGFFSMWVHQMILCLILFVSVVTTVIVYERVHIREAQHEMRYQLLSTYEDEDVEHVYLSSD